MKHLYGDYPHAWGRIKSMDQSPADYASAIERTRSTDYSPAWYVWIAAIAAVSTLVIWWSK